MNTLGLPSERWRMSDTILLAVVIAILGFKCWIGVHQHPPLARVTVVDPQ